MATVVTANDLNNYARWSRPSSSSFLYVPESRGVLRKNTMQRTYSRKAANRRNRLSDRVAPISSDSDSEPPGPPAKRQKLTSRQDKSLEDAKSIDGANRPVGLKSPGTLRRLTQLAH